jgi:hypothetical protein
MSYFVTILGAALVIVALCMLAMAVGVIIRNKSFKSCGCASITYQGERIDCPSACPESPETSCEREAKAEAEERPTACCRVLEASIPPRNESRPK